MIDEKLKQLQIEDFIWVIYIGIIFLSWYANDLERKYFIFNDKNSKEEYRKIMILIFLILIMVYGYFLFDSYKSLQSVDNMEAQKLNYISFIASLLIFISGLLLLYIAYKDRDLNVEIAFN